VLFSEPKIPQFAERCARRLRKSTVSVLFSEPKIPQFERNNRYNSIRRAFQCSSASRKFLNCRTVAQRGSSSAVVSVLFSEPKIPQFAAAVALPERNQRGFSALQRAENSSICWFCPYRSTGSQCFSALQRAENSSI